MNERKRILLLVCIMMSISIIIGGVSILLLYRTAYHDERECLRQYAQSQARLIEAVARFDKLYSSDFANGPIAATVSQIMDAHTRLNGFGATGEFVFAKSEKGRIVFLHSHQKNKAAGDNLSQVAVGSLLAVPMQLALQGKSGVITALDYRGEMVLAAYEPINDINLGIVVKKDLAEIQAPFFKTAWICGAIAFLFISLGTILFFRITGPILAKLTEKERRYRTLVQNIPGVVFRCGANHPRPMVHISNMSQELTGYAPDRYLGAGGLVYDNLIVAEDLPRVEQAIAHGLAVHKSYAVEYRILHADGSIRWVRENGRGVYEDDNEVRWLDGVIVDISEQKKIEVDLLKAKEHAEQSNRYKGEFLANMSHEIRTPMNAIVGMTSLALKKTITPKIREYLEMIRASSNSLLAIINDILDLSKIESNKLAIEKIDFNLHEILANLNGMFKEKAREKNLKFSVDVTGVVPPLLQGDPLRLGQVLVNLVGNSIKFTEHGEVLVSISSKKQSEEEILLHFAVTDTGIGIDQAKLANIFDEFVQADGSMTRNHGGSGLGLSICKKLVGLMGGVIEVESTPGAGSTFSFELLFGVQKSVIEDMIVGEFSGKNFLVVDDELPFIHLMEESLQMTGAGVCGATLPSEALKILREKVAHGFNFDMIIMDLVMPEQDGISTARKIRAIPQLAATPIIILTGYGKEFDEHRARQAGISAFLYKPITLEILLDNIRALLFQQPVAEKSGHDPKQGAVAELLKGRRVLLVEDNRFNQLVAQEVLSEAEMVVELANNGLEALEKLDEVFDIILMDVQMPGMDGLEATRRIRLDHKYDHIPIIAMTAHAMNEDRHKCLEAGMDDYISKPFLPNDLFIILAKYLVAHARSAEAIFVQIEEEGDGGRVKAVVDEAMLRKRLQDTYKMDSEKIDKIMTAAKATLVDHLTKGGEQLAQGNKEEFSATAHTLKGTLALLGLDQLAALAGRLEKGEIRARDQDFDAAVNEQLNALAESLKFLLDDHT